MIMMSDENNNESEHTDAGDEHNDDHEHEIMDDERDSSQGNSAAAYKCKFCNIIFDEYSLYSIHAGMHANENPWQCNVCGHECANKVEFAVHILHLPKNL